MVRVAVGMGADVNRRLQEAWPLMTYCAGGGCLEAVKACLAAGAQVDAAIGDDDREWWTAVVHAGREGHEAVVEALLEAGASAKVGCDGRDQTMVAMCDGLPTPGIVRRLAEAEADVTALGSGGWTAIHLAAYRGNLAAMEALVDLGANMIAVNRRTAMHFAANGEAVRWLMACGVSIQGDGDNSFPLLTACANGQIRVARSSSMPGAS